MSVDMTSKPYQCPRTSPSNLDGQPSPGYDTLGPASHELVLIIVTMLLPTLALAQQQGVVALT